MKNLSFETYLWYELVIYFIVKITIISNISYISYSVLDQYNLLKFNYNT